MTSTRTRTVPATTAKTTFKTSGSEGAKDWARVPGFRESRGNTWPDNKSDSCCRQQRRPISGCVCLETPQANPSRMPPRESSNIGVLSTRVPTMCNWMKCDDHGMISLSVDPTRGIDKRGISTLSGLYLDGCRARVTWH